MSVQGWILDASPARGGLTLVLSDGWRRVRVGLRVTYDLYLRPKEPVLMDQLLMHPEAVSVAEEEWLSPPWYTKKVPVSRLSLSCLSAYEELKAFVQKEALAEVVNAFPDPMTQVFYKLGFPATAHVEVGDGSVRPCGATVEGPYLGPKDVKVLEDPLAIGYEAPHYSWAEVRFFDWFGETTSSTTRHWPERFELTMSRGGEPPRGEAGRLSRLSEFADEISTVDAIMYPSCFKGILLRSGVRLDTIPLALKRHSPGSSTLPDELVKLVEWSRVSFMPMRELVGVSIGKALTANEVRLAFTRRYIIPEIISRVERRKTLDDLTAHDRGGILFRPVPGIYWNVAQLDFASMYPTLIAKWNISPETVNFPSPNAKRVPATNHTVEPPESRRGVVPEALEWLIARREETRRLSQGDRTQDLRQGAVKWLLVASFGYLGFRNARFGKIEAHECVTALARYYMGQSIRIATDRGFTVLHVMVDSLFVRKDGCKEGEVKELMEAIARETGLKIKLEALYDWVILCNNKGTALGSPARYFGRLSDGTLKVKGLDLVKRDTPGIVRATQTSAVKVLLGARTAGEFSAKLREVGELFDDAVGRVVRGEVAPDDWVFTVARGRRVDRDNLLGRWGDVPFVQIIQGEEPYLAELGFSGVNREHYAKLLERAREQLTPANLPLPDPRPQMWEYENA
jgi:DNA polymerase I